MTVNLAGLTLAQVILVAAITMGVDIATGILGALRDTPSTFSWAFLANFLESHVLARIIPIAGLVFIGQTIGGSEGAGLFGLGLVGLASYVAQTVVSVGANISPTVSGGSGGAPA
ncbi:MAG: hypothetical protein ACYDCI_06625 [Candidatus Limnocylindrales bacterium]